MANAGRLRVLLSSVRVRTTLTATLVVACILAIGGFAFVALLEASLIGTVQDVAQQRAGTVARQLAREPHPRQFIQTGTEELFVQIVDARDRRVLASSDPHLTQPVRSLLHGKALTIYHVPIGDGTHSFRTVSKVVHIPKGILHVTVGGSLEHVFESTRTVTRMLLYGIPGLLVLVVLTTWLFMGRALRPVESIRREVADISARDLNRRVLVPDSGDEIARLAETMNAMLGRLAESSQRQRRFISDASHELRSPVASLRAVAEVADEYPDSTTLQEFATTVLSEEKRLEALVDDLLVLARADENSLVHRREPVDVDDLVLAEAARLRAASTLRIDTAKVSAARVQGDAGSLRRAIRNVADNAMRHASNTIGFEVSSSGNTATVAVIDDGAGIAEADRGRIFERFIRLEASRDRDSGGSGLGLSIVTEIINAHEGTVTVSDAPETGARFELSLPAIGADGHHGGETADQTIM
jgi:signal transduction histidine kinase